MKPFSDFDCNRRRVERRGSFGTVWARAIAAGIPFGTPSLGDDFQASQFFSVEIVRSKPGEITSG